MARHGVGGFPGAALVGLGRPTQRHGHFVSFFLGVSEFVQRRTDSRRLCRSHGNGPAFDTAETSASKAHFEAQDGAGNSRRHALNSKLRALHSNRRPPEKFLHQSGTNGENSATRVFFRQWITRNHLKNKAQIFLLNRNDRLPKIRRRVRDGYFSGDPATENPASRRRKLRYRSPGTD
jgi:hypothetical protein